MNFSQVSGSNPFSSIILMELETLPLTSTAKFAGAGAEQSSHLQGLVSFNESIAI